MSVWPVQDKVPIGKKGSLISDHYLRETLVGKYRSGRRHLTCSAASEGDPCELVTANEQKPLNLSPSCRLDCN